jgi:two-component system NtrC family sensor kinase
LKVPDTMRLVPSVSSLLRRCGRSLTRVSLRVKILVPILVVILGSGTLLSWMVHREVEEVLTQQFSDRVGAILSELTNRATQEVLIENFHELNKMIRRAATLPDIVYVYLENHNHEILAHTFDHGMPIGLAETTRLPLGKETRVISLRTEKGMLHDHAMGMLGGRIGALHLGVSTARIREESDNVSKQIFLVTILAAAVSVGVIYLITFILTQPIRELTRSLVRVGKGDFSIRSDIRSGDEIGELAGQFNAMTERLAEWERKLAEAQQLILRTERLATIGKIASGVAHEIGNPLHAVQQFSRALQDHPERMDQYLPLIQEGLQRMHRVVYQLKDYARERSVHQKIIDIHEVIESSIRFLEHHARDKSARVRFEPDRKIPTIRGDPDALGQVVTNVFINSLEAISVDGSVYIKTFWSPSHENGGGRIGILITDNGPGIEDNALEKVFDPFFTTKEIGQGTGLGLSICQDIVGLHGGSIEVVSEKGSGATFTIWLPVRPEDGNEEKRVEKNPDRGR